jgi:hypothetical protein
MNATKPLITAVIVFLLIPVVALVATVGLISSSFSSQTAACAGLTRPQARAVISRRRRTGRPGTR